MSEARPSNPRLVNCGIENQNGIIVVSGEVIDDYDLTTCSVFLTSAVPEFNNITCPVDLEGHWNHSAQIGNVKNGAIRAVATQTSNGLTSEPWDDWIG